MTFQKTNLWRQRGSPTYHHTSALTAIYCSGLTRLDHVLSVIFHYFFYCKKSIFSLLPSTFLLPLLFSLSLFSTVQKATPGSRHAKNQLVATRLNKSMMEVLNIVDKNNAKGSYQNRRRRTLPNGSNKSHLGLFWYFSDGLFGAWYKPKIENDRQILSKIIT